MSEKHTNKSSKIFRIGQSKDQFWVSHFLAGLPQQLVHIENFSPFYRLTDGRWTGALGWLQNDDVLQGWKGINNNAISSFSIFFPIIY
jgi:hypothetical protein